MCESASVSLADRLIAHRGYAARYPENTLLAIERAIAKGARYVEVDLQLSADLEPVLYHDRDMQRLSDACNKIQLLRWDELERYSLHNPPQFGDKFQDEPIAHLQHLINLMLVHPEVTFFLEFKRNAIEAFGAEAFLHAVLPLLIPVAKQVILISFSEGLVRLAAEQGWAVGQILDHFPEPDWQQQLGVKPDYLFLNYRYLEGNDLIAQRRFWGDLQVVVYDITDPEIARQLMANGVDLVETFSISIMRRLLS